MNLIEVKMGIHAVLCIYYTGTKNRCPTLQNVRGFVILLRNNSV